MGLRFDETISEKAGVRNMNLDMRYYLAASNLLVLSIGYFMLCVKSQKYERDQEKS